MSRIHRVEVSNGSPEGTNSAYVLRDRGVVVDPGPPIEGAWDRLVAGISDAGLELDDVSSVLVTHWHADHAGLAPRLCEASDATLYMHEADAPFVADYAAERERRVNRDARRLAEWGVPEETVEPVVKGDTPSPMPETYPVETLADGDIVAGVETLHTPGHTLGHAAFVDEESESLFVGDAVLPTYTPNVGGSDTRVADALATYRETLTRLREQAERVVISEIAHPGHGTELPLVSRVDEILSHHETRTERVYDCVDAHDPLTPWQVATRLFGEMRGIHVKMGAGEAAAHLSALASAGRVAQVESEPLVYAVK
ncbi:MBL fold metallo-hydrolase [Haloprofundus marisrubri]|uniref:MBL fold metallo-hydrolase n=1 Tax=Haloprofundus marisrubri TaxID=1514971 RepID=A0A0W1R2T3_9EURY|nr:MBL fold metallo-hydrolase [Haloprofundus marisrubri]KTG07621.1 MBL fold metallo-hydrolase [Haloprofundus marisrubri]